MIHAQRYQALFAFRVSEADTVLAKIRGCF
jgi:hypothetical protein